MVPPFRGNAQGNAQGNQNLTRTQGGVSQKQQGGCPIHTFQFSLSLFGSSSYDRPTRTAPEVRGKTGATPPFVPLARHGEGRVSGTVSGTVSAPPRLRGGRSRLYVSLREGSSARTRAGRSAATRGPMLDRFIRAFLVVGGVSVACAWTWPGAFPEADPVAVLVRYRHPERVPRRRRVVLRGARRGRVPGRPVPSRHIPDLVRPDGRQCRAPVPPSDVAAFAYGRRAGDRRRRGPSPGQSHRVGKAPRPEPGLTDSSALPSAANG